MTDIRLTRRGMLRTGTALAAAAAGSAWTTTAAEAATLQRFEQQQPAPSSDRILLRGGAIISMDDKIGDLAQADLLIEGSRIAAIAPDLKADDAQVIDARDTIIVPGFVDAHRHCWEGQLRLLNPNSPTLIDYRNATHLSFAKAYRPQDIYAGNYLSAVGCIDAGVTCVIDNSHNSRSAEHSDAAVEALIDSGIRALHASGAPQAGEWDRQWPQDLERLQKKYFSSTDQLLTLGMFSGFNRGNWEIARRLGLRISSEFLGAEMAPLLASMAQAKLVGPHNTFNHCDALPEETWKLLVDSGAAINVCPRSCAQYALGEFGLQQALDHGVRPGLSVDNETSYGGDMFAEMRVAFYLQRALAQTGKATGGQSRPAPIMTRDVLYCATMGGARCAGLDGKIGSLTPGKEADLIVIRADDINLYPSNNAVGTVVQAADRSNIETVIIGGRVRKFNGKVVGLDSKGLKAMVEASREHLFDAVGYRPDPFAQLLPKLN